MTVPLHMPDSVPDPDSGADDAPPGDVGTLEDEGTSTDTPPGSRESGDYLARVRGDGEFAVDEIRNKDRAVTKANQDAQALKERWESIDPFYDQLGGGQGVLNNLSRLNTLLTNPQMKKMVEQFEKSGTVPTGDEDWEYEDTETSKPWESDIHSMQEQLQSLTTRVTQQDLDDHFTRIRREFSGDWDELSPELEKQFQRWQHDPKAQNLLQNMTYDSMKTVALNILYGDREKRIQRGKKEYEESLRQRQSRATDAPSGIAHPPQERPSNAPLDVVSAFKEFKEREGITEELRIHR